MEIPRWVSCSNTRWVPVTTFTLVTWGVTPVDGGRYGDPSQLTTLLVPTALAVFILIAMLGLLCFFKRRHIKDKCCFCCMKRSRPEEIVMQNAMGSTANSDSGRAPTSFTNHAYNQEETGTKAIANGKPHDQEIGHSQLGHSCPGCGSPYKAGDSGKGNVPPSGETSQLQPARTSFFSKLFHLKKDKNDLNSDKEGYGQSSDHKCDICVDVTYRRNTLKEEDITKVGLTLDTQDVWHI